MTDDLQSFLFGYFVGALIASLCVYYFFVKDEIDPDVGYTETHNN